MAKTLESSEQHSKKCNPFAHTGTIFTLFLDTGGKSNCTIPSLAWTSNVTSMYTLLEGQGIKCEKTKEANTYTLAIDKVPPDKHNAVCQEMAKMLEDCWKKGKGNDTAELAILLPWILAGAKMPLSLPKSNGATQLIQLLNVVLVKRGISTEGVFELGEALNVVVLKKDQVLSREKRQALVTFLLGVIQQKDLTFIPISLNPDSETPTQTPDLVRWAEGAAIDTASKTLEIQHRGDSMVYDLCAIVEPLLFGQTSISGQSLK